MACSVTQLTPYLGRVLLHMFGIGFRRFGTFFFRMHRCQLLMDVSMDVMEIPAPPQNSL